MAGLMREAEFEQSLRNFYRSLENLKNYDLIVGILFEKEDPNLREMLEKVDKLLFKWMGKRQLIVCIGDSQEDSNINFFKDIKISHPCLEWHLPEGIQGRGMKVRALLEMCKFIDADLIFFSTDALALFTDKDYLWLDQFIFPIQGNYDMAIGAFNADMDKTLLHLLLVSPVLEVFYGLLLEKPWGGVYALAHDFIEELAHEARFWGDLLSGEGIDFWLVSRALCWNKSVCRVDLKGEKGFSFTADSNRVKETLKILLTAIKRDSAVWLKDRLLTRKVDASQNNLSDRSFFYADLLPRMREAWQGAYQDEKNRLDLLKPLYPTEVKRLLKHGEEMEEVRWAYVLTELMLLYSFADEEKAAEIIEILTACYAAYAANFIKKMEFFADELKNLEKEEVKKLLGYKADEIRCHLVARLKGLKPDFNRRWLELKEQHKPPIIPLGYMEYVPNKPVVVPKTISGKDERVVNTDAIFRHLRKVYEEKFDRFLSEGLGIRKDASPDLIVRTVESFMSSLEKALEEIFPGHLYTEEGLDCFVNGIMELFPQEMFTINDEILREMLMRFPPLNLMIPLGFYKPQDLIQDMDVRDAVTYANLIESWSYTDRDLLWLVENIRPESFGRIPLKPLVLKDDIVQGGGLSGHKISYLNRITARVAVRKLPAERGGKYPRLRYFTSILRRLALAESYGELFELTVKQRKNIGEKIKNSLLPLAKGEDFSAYHIFENYQHRRLVDKVRKLAEKLQEEGEKEKARLFQLMADSYGLSQVLEDGTFLSCTAWSWAGYSFKGGLKIPTPFTTSVESRWFNHEFLEALYQELGYEPGEIKDIVYRLIQQGKSSHNLLDTLLPARPKDVAVVVQEITNEPSRYLKRYDKNPILEPVKEHRWESKYVLNPGALRIRDKVYLFYRAVGEDNVSHIGLAITDGFNVIERLPRPIFSPVIPEERMGCEDPRVIIMGDKIFMLYTAYDGNIAQVACASIKLSDFEKGNYTAWKREGLAFTNIWDKDAVIWPEKIKGKYVIYHRIEPSIWVTYTDELRFPIKEKHAIIAGPRPGRMWDSLKIGAGAQPLKTKYGWLLIYHGVDHNYIYRLGVLLADLENPGKILYRSLNPILEPEKDYEVGLDGAWVPNVVFTCGAVPAEDKEILEDDDEILVYYGAADTSIGVATGKLADLIPEAFRK